MEKYDCSIINGLLIQNAKRQKHMNIINCETDMMCSFDNRLFTFVEIIAIEFNKTINLSNISIIDIYYGENMILTIPFNILYKTSNVTRDRENIYITIKKNLFPVYNGMLYALDRPYIHMRTFDGFMKINYKLHIKCIYDIEYLSNSHKRVGDITKISINQHSTPFNQYFYHETVFSDTYKIPFICNMTGFFLETTRLKNLKILLDIGQKVILNEFNQYVLTQLIVNKDIWTYKKSKMFNLIMGKILPYEIINYIESYINDIYLYYIPVHMDNTMLSVTNSYVDNSYVKNERILKNIEIVFDEPKISNICYISTNYLISVGGLVRVHYIR